MATTREQISEWFEQGVKQKFTHMLIVCDTFDWDDYPVFAKNDEEALFEYQNNNGQHMQKVMEVYDLRADKAEQLNETRAMHLPIAK